MDLHYVYIGPCLFLWAAIHYQYGAVQQSTQMKVQHNTTLLSLCREICLLARHLHKTVNTFNNKTSTTQWNTEIKTDQIQGKFLTVAMYTRTHGGMHAPTPPPPPHTHTVSLSHTRTHTHTHINKTTTDHFTAACTRLPPCRAPHPYPHTVSWPPSSLSLIGHLASADVKHLKMIYSVGVLKFLQSCENRRELQ